MIRVKIFKNAVQTHGSDFPSLLEAEVWINDNISSNSWGKPDRWLTEQQCLDEGIDFSSLETRLLYETLEYKVPKEYTIETSDVSGEYQAALDILESQEAINVGVEIITKVRTINKSKLRGLEWDAAKFNSLLVNPTMAQTERACWTGSLGTAKALVQSLDNTYYSASEKQLIVDLIDAHLIKWS